MGLRRRDYSNIDQIFEFIRNELTQSSQHGYRWMHQKLQENGLISRKEDVRLILALLDPEGVAAR